jgi:hypothetical protein
MFRGSASTSAPRWRRRAWLGVLVAAAVAARARAAEPDLDSLAPDGARPLAERGPWDNALADALQGLSDALARDHGPLDFHRWRLSSSLELAAAQAQVHAALGADWEPVAGLPRRAGDAQMRGWQRRGFFFRRPVFAFAWLDTPARVDEGPPVRLLVTAVPRRD